MTKTILICPLCKSNQTKEFCRDINRCYCLCVNCDLVFVPPVYFLSESEEKKRYNLHQNDPNDKNYCNFLSRLFIPMKEKLVSGGRSRFFGLDFGSGPGPALSGMFEKEGHKMDIYDYFYAKDDKVFDRKYDFITTTEVIEHLRKPREELDRLWRCLRKDGYFGLMTKLLLQKETFQDWFYKRDDTHICFYSKKTFNFLAKIWSAEIEFINKDVVIFKKPLNKRENCGTEQTL